MRTKPFYLAAAFTCISQFRESTLQPEIHHRVVLNLEQPPLPFGSGLDSRSLDFSIFDFQLLLISTGATLYWRNFLQCIDICQVRRFSPESRTNTTGCFLTSITAQAVILSVNLKHFMQIFSQKLQFHKQKVGFSFIQIYQKILDIKCRATFRKTNRKQDEGRPESSGKRRTKVT
jgi:hypothetical protein